MRNFEDHEGRTWDATVGRESWGTLVLIFTPRAAGGARRSLLGAESHVAAETELERLSDRDLRERLCASDPWG